MMDGRKFWLFACVGLGIVFLALSWYLSQQHMKDRLDFVSSRLALLGELRTQALQDYFATADAELRFWTTEPTLVSSQEKLVSAFRARLVTEEQRNATSKDLQRFYITENPYPEQRSKMIDSASDNGYTRWHASFHPTARLFVEERGYYDFFMVTPEGFVLYTVEKEADFATNLRTGPWRDSPLARVFEQAMLNAAAGVDAVSISDMALYEPSAGAPAIFMAKAIPGDNGEILGVLALQLPLDRIQDIMRFASGLGESGQIYLVGEDLLMRSDSRFGTGTTTLKQKVDTATVHRAFDRESGVQIIEDYRGVKVLSAYRTVEIDDNHWAVIAELERKEILEDASGDRPWIIPSMLFLYVLSLGSLWFLRSDGGTSDSNLSVADLLEQ